MAVCAAILPVRPSNSISAAKGVHPPPTTHHSRRFFLQILDQTLHSFAQLREDFRDGTRPDLLKPFEKSRPGAAAFEAVICLGEQMAAKAQSDQQGTLGQIKTGQGVIAENGKRLCHVFFSSCWDCLPCISRKEGNLSYAHIYYLFKRTHHPIPAGPRARGKTAPGWKGQSHPPGNAFQFSSWPFHPGRVVKREGRNRLWSASTKR